MPSFRDRFFTPRTARAITSPGAIIGAGLGASVGIVAGAPLAAAGLVGAAAYAGIVALKMPRAHHRPDVDPQRLREPWRRYVVEALDAAQRFDQAVDRARIGPLKTRLERIADRIDDGVAEVWRIAQQGEALEEALRHLDPVTEVRERLARVEGDLAGARAGDPHLEQMADAMRSQLASTERIDRVASETRDRLQVLDARLDEAVARAVELSFSSSDSDALGGLGSDVDTIVGEMEALRLALEDTAAAS